MTDPVDKDLYQYISDSQEDEAATEAIAYHAEDIWSWPIADVYDALLDHRNCASETEVWAQIDQAMTSLLDAAMLEARLALEDEAELAARLSLEEEEDDN